MAQEPRAAARVGDEGMSERSTLIWSAMVGAAVGVGVGYLLFTERGRRLREDVTPELETLVREAMRLGSAVEDLRHGRPAGEVGRVASAPRAWPRRTP